MSATMSEPVGSGWRRRRRIVLVVAVALASVLFLAGLVRWSPTASAANIAIDQCDGIGPGINGATTTLTCDVTVVNTINGAARGSTTTVTIFCALTPCGNGTFVTTSTNLVTSVHQCNGSDNDAAGPIICHVSITDDIRADTPGAEPVTPATVDQCVGSATGVVTPNCVPFPATTTGATVTQCNGSANGGGGLVNCTVTASTVSAALPLTINQCNGSGNPGGSTVTCSTSITTNITPVPVSPSPSPSASPSVSSPGSPSASGSPSGTRRPSGSPAPSGRGTPTSRASGGTRSPSASRTPTSRASSGTRTPTSTATSQVTETPRGGADTGS